MSKGTISIICITGNDDFRLKSTLACCMACDDVTVKEMILVDDTATGAIELRGGAIHHWSKLKIIRGQRLGRAAARNRGAMVSRGKLLVFIDADVLFSKKFIQGHLQFHLETSFKHVLRGKIIELLGAAGCTDLCQGGAGFPPLNLGDLRANGFSAKGYRQGHNLLEQVLVKRQDEQREDIPSWLASCGANFSIARHVWQRLEGQCESFGLVWGCEDLEFSYRAGRKNVRVEYVPAVIAFHLSHPQPNRWHCHERSLALFKKLHDDPEIAGLDQLLGQEGSLARYVAALADIRRQTYSSGG